MSPLLYSTRRRPSNNIIRPRTWRSKDAPESSRSDKAVVRPSPGTRTCPGPRPSHRLRLHAALRPLTPRQQARRRRQPRRRAARLSRHTRRPAPPYCKCPVPVERRPGALLGRSCLHDLEPRPTYASS
ncbi:hypothetical protein IEO21_08309 [Rhodonia placenta]|uniref:Uncharacterized protein n=1 Tax=Rhodonia placenta TaxID=104341 RepID=A0A8H7NWT7_9APHY|nr:hypothetical protein IEO21_08309 [Postia placenta]